MGNEKAILDELDQLRLSTSSDFSALALIDDREHRIRWAYASGNDNERYRQISLRMGRGLAGMAIRLGRPIVVDSSVPGYGQVSPEYSIMLAENLRAAIAVPVPAPGGIRGVLLVGSRAERVYPQEVIVQVTQACEHVAPNITQHP